MAESKRAGVRPARRGRKARRLTTLDLALNAVAVLGVVPALVALGILSWMGQFGGQERNEHLFLGAVMMLLAVFLLMLTGLKLYEHVKARRRFRELLSGDRKSAVMQNLDELTSLARDLGPDYRRRLEGRLDELGVKR